MSHYTVAVITKNRPERYEIDDMLAPYDEGLKVEPYVVESFNNVLAYYEKILKEELEEARKDPQKWQEREKALKELEPILAAKDIKGLNRWLSENSYYQWYEQLNDKGEAVSTYNPLSKWDWYEIGGRWSGELNGKNSMPLKDLRQEVERGKYTEQQLIEKYPKDYETYKLCLKEGDGWYNEKYYQKRYKTFEDYLLTIKNFATYSILTPDGDWLESGKMGWWGISYATSEEQADFANSYYDVIDKIKDQYPEAWITLVDCHI